MSHDEDRTWRLMQADWLAHEKPPTGPDADLAGWCDRKAAAADIFRDEALAAGDTDSADRMQAVQDHARRTAHRLRRGPGGA